jgi:uroporphyrinogen decarboxylase
MTPREKFIACLKREPITGNVPTFELEYFLTMEKLGKVHPYHRSYRQWHQMSSTERMLHNRDLAETFLGYARAYEYSALHMGHLAGQEAMIDMFSIMRDEVGDSLYFSCHGDPTFAIPNGDEMVDFAYRLVDEPQKVKDEAQQRVDEALEFAAKHAGSGLIDGFNLCSDYCFNDNPFLSPEQFAEFVAPYLRQTIAEYRGLGYYVIKHTDGNIMPIVDQIVACEPHGLHSLDPQAGVDIAEVKRLYGEQVCLIGNVNCGLIDTGTLEEVGESVRYALRHGMPGYGYIFSTSNCVYTGMALERYEYVWNIWKTEGVY